MALTIGARVGPYEILAPIGAGGMGEVYRARDTRLGRQVAIKVLPSEVAQDPARRIRFEREARAVSSLNHPHICTLHDIGQQDGVDYLVMEYLEGETLAGRLEKGALPLPQALRIGSQIADALDKAHGAGIVHRDLKPGNIVLTKSGAKLLDFGLAKLRAAGSDAEAGVSSLVTKQKADDLTGEGAILGTFNYMAPEQLEGGEVDARTDIFTFGAVLYEMTTGKRAFTGKSQASLVSAILTSDPAPMSILQPLTPPALDRLVKKCLAKEPQERWQTAKDLMDELKWIADGAAQMAASSASPISRARWLGRWALLAAVVGVAVITGLAITNLRRSPAAPVGRLAIPLSPGERFTQLNAPSVVLSPDGESIVYVVERAGAQQLFLRSMNTFEAKPIAGTESGSAPFFSPDSRSLGYFAEGKLKIVSTSGGAPVTLADVTRGWWGGTWGPRDTIAYVTDWNVGLLQISAAGGTPEQLTTVDREKGEVGHLYPEFLPGGEALLLTVATETNAEWDESLIQVQSLETGKRRVLVQEGSNAHYVPTGHLVYVRAGTLMAVPFTLKSYEVTGPPVPILDGIAEGAAGVAQFSFSRLGNAAYIPGSPEGTHRRMVWVDRNGVVQPLGAPPQMYMHPRLSPDARSVAAWIGRLNCDLTIYDTVRETMTRLTFGGDNHAPVWTPDGKRITYESRKPGGDFNLFWKPTDGSGSEEQLAGDERKADSISSVSWSPDGKVLAYVELDPNTGKDIWLLTADGNRKATPFLESAFDEETPMFSPDGRWLAYISNESRRVEVYVRPYLSPGGKWQISTEGGTQPVWSRDGRELFYRNGKRMMVVDISTQGGFSTGKPKMLFEMETPAPYGAYSDYDVSPDGRRFLMLKDTEEPATQIHVILNWFDELKRKVPTRN